MMKLNKLGMYIQSKNISIEIFFFENIYFTKKIPFFTIIMPLILLQNEEICEIYKQCTNF